MPDAPRHMARKTARTDHDHTLPTDTNPQTLPHPGLTLQELTHIVPHTTKTN